MIMKEPKALEMSTEVREVLQAVFEDYDTEGCEGMGTIMEATINKVRVALGYEPYDNGEDDDLS